MDRRKFRNVLARCKEEAKLDYALEKAPADCASCSQRVIFDMFGGNSRGIWTKWFGVMQGEGSWAEMSKQGFYIGHYLTKRQEKTVLKILAETYDVEWNGEPTECIFVKSKLRVKKD